MGFLDAIKKMFGGKGQDAPAEQAPTGNEPPLTTPNEEPAASAETDNQENTQGVQ